MERRFGLVIVGVVGLATTLTLAACQKAAAPAANAANAAPAVANATVTSLVAPPPPAAAQSPDAAAAEAFLDGLYAHYKASSSTGTTWAPMDANIKEVFDADMVKLMAADTKALKGDLGEIDGDWLCDCQDWGSIAAKVTIISATPTEAKAAAVFHDTQIKDEPPKRDTFDLVKTPAGWRIHDMGTSDQPSLRGVLIKEIADLTSGKAKPLNETDGPP
jgi:hypothetical protein